MYSVQRGVYSDLASSRYLKSVLLASFVHGCRVVLLDVLAEIGDLPPLCFNRSHLHGHGQAIGILLCQKVEENPIIWNPPPDPGQEPSHPATDQEALQPRAAQSAIFTRRNAWTVEIPRDHIMPRSWENGYPGNPVGSVLTGGTVLHQCHRIEINP
ncbi:hypothetical protein OS493_014042 [Desmophyllum pertusum]|uniref:Uncharacterized protein n=1 Tax=Desmophyllum pertusum TaxID=174260 RepID=A0A9X0CXX9_9CNID|nr:hypothetical protein OS493_014042 [Desmophyllum pertusum]